LYALIAKFDYDSIYAKYFNTDIIGLDFCHQLAIAQTKYKPGTIYNGVGSSISTHNPSVTGSQYSSAELILQSGSDSIQVGWTVN